MKTKSTIWIAIGVYIAFIYLTLPLMRPSLNFLYGFLGRQNLGIMVNIVFLIVAGFLIFSIKNQPLNRIFYNILLFCIAIGLIFMLEIPEERVHFLEYGVLGFFVLKATNEKIFITFIFVALVGAVDEFIQFLLPQRVGELRDVAMNIIGGALGIWVRKLQN